MFILFSQVYETREQFVKIFTSILCIFNEIDMDTVNPTLIMYQLC